MRRATFLLALSLSLAASQTVSAASGPARRSTPPPPARAPTVGDVVAATAWAGDATPLRFQLSDRPVSAERDFDARWADIKACQDARYAAAVARLARGPSGRGDPC